MPPSANRALADAIAFVQGVGDQDPVKAAAYVVEQLALRGFCVQPISAPMLSDLSAETLQRVRKSLGLTAGQLAAEAGLGLTTVTNAENGNTQSHWATRHAIGDALVRLGAVRPTPADYVEALNNANPAGALSRLGLEDKEGIMIRAALDLIGPLREPPVTGSAAIRAALKDYLIGIGRWSGLHLGEDE